MINLHTPVCYNPLFQLKPQNIQFLHALEVDLNMFACEFADPLHTSLNKNLHLPILTIHRLLEDKTY